ncbi:MAG: hypothetical protein K1Y01_12645 [Vicinamibacteria bacterium]|nr:hypothetical protein [Vicinamibacteria bacterium]
MKLAQLGVAALALALPSCYDFHTVGPEDPPPLALPQTVSVAISYLQPLGCVPPGSNCGGPVTFYGSWMPIGSYVTLQQTAAHTWTATVPNVPFNYPGVDPYRVYAVDPYLHDTLTGGVVAFDRLTVGGERIVKVENGGGTREQGLIFIDANGKGRTP